MGQSSAGAETHITAASLRTPRAAAVAGIVFSLLLGLALVLIRLSVPVDPTETGELLSDPDRRSTIEFALGLVPFAGIAFLWFIGVIRDRIGEHEDRLFATVFLGSGLLLVGMLFVAAAVAGGLIAAGGSTTSDAASSETWNLGYEVTFTLLNVYAMRMGAVFAITAASIGKRSGVLPPWLAIAGYVAALILLFGVPVSGWLALLLPIWVLILSVYLLLRPTAR